MLQAALADTGVLVSMAVSKAPEEPPYSPRPQRVLMETAEPSLRKRVRLLSQVTTALLVALVALAGILWKEATPVSLGPTVESE